MSALDELRNKKVNTQVELCILYWGDPVNGSDENIEEAEQAAAELAALNARVEGLEKKARLFMNSLPVDEIELAREVFGNTNTRLILAARSELEAALKGAE